MSKKVFLVDDDLDIIEQNKLVLEAKGYSVVTAMSAREAEETLKKGIKVDIIILDVMMEHKTAGLELAKKISTDKNLPNVPIILLTSDGNNPNWLAQDKFTWNNIVRVLDKPTAPAKLIEMIEKLTK
ncbi:MAG TPA: response regulator [bacterium]|nr:response regulator [bacterium]HPS29528.1 response regulator [bacterium]